MLRDPPVTPPSHCCRQCRRARRWWRGGLVFRARTKINNRMFIVRFRGRFVHSGNRYQRIWYQYLVQEMPFVLYLPTYLQYNSFFTSPPSFLGAERTSSAKRGWRPSLTGYTAETVGYTHSEKTKTRNWALGAELWIGKLRQNTTRRTVLRGRKHFNVRKEVLLWGFV